jgi:hypothetical protein
MQMLQYTAFMVAAVRQSGPWPRFARLLRGQAE